MKAISIFRGNSKTIFVTVTGLDLSGFDAYLTVKADFSEPTLITSTGVIDGEVITFALDNDDTDITSGEFLYDVVVTKDDDAYTLVQSKFIIKQSVKFSV